MSSAIITSPAFLEDLKKYLLEQSKPFDTFTGIDIIASEHIRPDRVQVSYPSSRKRRIRKKWAKRECNFRYREVAYMFNPSVPLMFDKPQKLVFEPEPYKARVEYRMPYSFLNYIPEEI